MKIRKGACLFLAFLMVSAPQRSLGYVTELAEVGGLSDVVRVVGQLLEFGHYRRERLNDENAEGSTRAKIGLERYCSLLDQQRMIFTQKDIDEILNYYGESVHRSVILGDLTPAVDIHQRYLTKLKRRIEWAEGLLDKDYGFNSDRSVEVERNAVDWAPDEEALDAIWRERTEGELLQVTLTDESELEDGLVDLDADGLSAKEAIAERWQGQLKYASEMDAEEITSTYLTGLMQGYDPHSEYLSKRTLDNLSIRMRLSLVGIGTELRATVGYPVVHRLIPGGPAARGGEVMAEDRIVGIAQEGEEFVDVYGMKIDKVVDLIRGEEGSRVSLKLLPSGENDNDKVKIVSLQREQVSLADEGAKAKVVDGLDAQGEPLRVGWIHLPSFYSELGGGAGSKSAAEDVAMLIDDIKTRGVDGIVIDLRSDSGGALQEAVKLVGLFVPSGPVVQAMDAWGNIGSFEISSDNTFWDGPVVVLMNRLSASASEIFAGAMQDYERAVIVGDSQSFGKGTVQTLLDVERFMPLNANRSKAGAVKLTTQKFYRVNGSSTQAKGVASDIVLPSNTDHPSIGEQSLPGHLGHDEVAGRKFTKTGHVSGVIPALREASEKRVEQSKAFARTAEAQERRKRIIRENRISLNRETRKRDLEKDGGHFEVEIMGENGESTPYKVVSNLKLGEGVVVEYDDEEDGQSERMRAAWLANHERAVTEEVMLIMGDLVDLHNSPRRGTVADRQLAEADISQVDVEGGGRTE